MTRNLIKPSKISIKDFDGDNVPEDFEFPSIGIENIDRALFNLFDNILNFEVTSKGKTIKVPVIFATGERFALTRRKNPIRDNNNTNILPLISIVRENIDIGANQGGKKTAISFRAQPNYTIKKRLSEKDRNFQNLINKQGLKNQDSASSIGNFIDQSNNLIADLNKTASRRETSNLKFSKNASVNIKPDINTNIYEIIQTPYPYFLSISYNVTFWCQYMQQGNQMIEYLLNKIDVPGGEFAIKTESGFELVAFIGENINFENNFDSMTDDERIIKYNFTLTIPGYLLNTTTPGLASQVRSYVSAPIIDFSYLQSNSPVHLDRRPETDQENVEKHVLTDITGIGDGELKRGQSNESIEGYVQNPFNNKETVELLKINTRDSRSGESVVSARIIKEIDRQYE
jgi:hypothetical protein